MIKMMKLYKPKLLKVNKRIKTIDQITSVQTNLKKLVTKKLTQLVFGSKTLNTKTVFGLVQEFELLILPNFALRT